MNASARSIFAAVILIISAAIAAPVNAEEYKDPATGMEFVFVKGGCYKMGDNFGDGGTDEYPLHEVCVDDFYMSKYSVTQAQWKAVMGSNPSYFKECGENCPVEQISWNDAQSFIQKLNKMSKTDRYRMAYEAEWEYAARSGGKLERHAGGLPLDSVAWYFENSDMKTQPVGTKAANGLGLFDMNGNVSQWCMDWDEKNYFYESPRNNPKGPTSGEFRCVRGGAWDSDAKYMRASQRSGKEPGLRSNSIGLRIVKTK